MERLKVSFPINQSGQVIQIDGRDIKINDQTVVGECHYLIPPERDNFGCAILAINAGIARRENPHACVDLNVSY